MMKLTCSLAVFAGFSARSLFCYVNCFLSLVYLTTLYLKNISDIFDCNLKNNCQIIIIFGTNISDTTCHQITIQFPTSFNVCFCTTWGKYNQRNITFLSNAI